jgi:hypothetical protein
MGRIKQILTSGSTPSATTFKGDDIVINSSDGKAFIKKADNSVIELGSGGSSGGASSPLVTADISTTYIGDFRNTSSAASNDNQASLVVLDLDTSDNAERVNRMTFNTFLSKSFISETLDLLTQISASQASGLFVDGVFFANGVRADLDGDGSVGVSDLLILLSEFGSVANRTTLNKEQLRDVNAVHQGFSITSSQFITGGLSTNFLEVTGSVFVSSSITASIVSASEYIIDNGGSIKLSNNAASISFTSAPNTLTFSVGGTEALEMSSTEVVFNDFGATGRNFRVEGDTDTHLLFVSGNIDKIGVGTNNPTEKLSVQGNISASGDIIGVINGGTF